MIAQPSPTKSWSLIFPWVVSASMFGIVSPIVSPGIFTWYIYILIIVLVWYYWYVTTNNSFNYSLYDLFLIFACKFESLYIWIWWWSTKVRMWCCYRVLLHEGNVAAERGRYMLLGTIALLPRVSITFLHA